MKKLLVLAILLLPVVAVAEGLVSGTCEQCPPGAGCVVRYGRCGETTCDAWCIEGRWFTSGKCMTLAILCQGGIEFTPAPLPPASP